MGYISYSIPVHISKKLLLLQLTRAWYQCSESVTLDGSESRCGSCSFRQWLSRRQQKMYFFSSVFMLIPFWRYGTLHFHHSSKIKSHKKSQNSRNPVFWLFSSFLFACWWKDPGPYGFGSWTLVTTNDWWLRYLGSVVPTRRYYEDLQEENKRYPGEAPFPWLEAQFKQLGLDVYRKGGLLFHTTFSNFFGFCSLKYSAGALIGKWCF